MTKFPFKTRSFDKTSITGIIKQILEENWTAVHCMADGRFVSGQRDGKSEQLRVRYVLRSSRVTCKHFWSSSKYRQIIKLDG